MNIYANSVYADEFLNDASTKFILDFKRGLYSIDIQWLFENPLLRDLNEKANLSGVSGRKRKRRGCIDEFLGYMNRNKCKRPCLVPLMNDYAKEKVYFFF
jgi:hypothetical protein